VALVKLPADGSPDPLPVPPLLDEPLDDVPLLDDVLVLDPLESSFFLGVVI
jgi:hypothetical protein